MKKVALATAAIGFVVWLVVRDRRSPSRALSWSTRQKLAGRLGQIKGTAKRTGGRLMGDRSLTVSGVVDQAVGTIRVGAGKTVDSAKGAMDSAKDAIDSAKDAMHA